VSLLTYKIIAAALIFLVSALTAAFIFKRRQVFSHTESLSIGEAIASGIFLGAAFFHLLPDAIRLFTQLHPTSTYPVPEAICIAGFISLLFLERLSMLQLKRMMPYVLTVSLTIHALAEGSAVGIGNTFSETTLLLIAILAHKGSESFALCVTMLRSQLPFARVIMLTLFFALMTPIGIGIGAMIYTFSFAQHGAMIESCFDAFAAGTFLYISTLHHIHFHQHQEEAAGWQEFFYLLCGVATMAIVAIWT